MHFTHSELLDISDLAASGIPIATASIRVAVRKRMLHYDRLDSSAYLTAERLKPWADADGFINVWLEWPDGDGFTVGSAYKVRVACYDSAIAELRQRLSRFASVTPINPVDLPVYCCDPITFETPP